MARVPHSVRPTLLSRALTNTTVVVVSTVFSVLALEGLVRVFAWRPVFGRLLVVRGSATRSVDGVPLWNDGHPRWDADDLQRFSTDRGSFKILGLGDSILYGDRLTKEETYLEQTRHLLERRSTRPVEVLNLAVKGYNTMQENAVYKEVEGRIRPDLVLVHFGTDDAHQYRAVGGYVVDFNDMSEVDSRLVVRALPLPPRVNDFLLVRSRLYDLLNQVVMDRRKSEPTDWSRVSDPLLDIEERVRRAGGRLLVLASPNLDGPSPRPNDHLPGLLQLGSSHGIEVIDLSEWLAGFSPSQIAFDGCHFNADGQRLIAERLSEYLLAHDLKE